MSEEVWLVMADTYCEGSGVQAVAASEAGANAEAARCTDASKKAQAAFDRWSERVEKNPSARMPKWPEWLGQGCTFSVSGPWVVVSVAASNRAKTPLTE